MGRRYGVGGRSAATAATADIPGAVLWNASGAKSIYVVQAEWYKQGAATADNLALIRTSTRGTVGSTVTPDIDNDYSRQVAPASGCLLDLASFSAGPTVQGPHLKRTNLAAAIGAGIIWAFHDEPIHVPAGTGLAFVTPTAVILQAGDVAFEWDE